MTSPESIDNGSNLMPNTLSVEEPILLVPGPDGSSSIVVAQASDMVQGPEHVVSRPKPKERSLPIIRPIVRGGSVLESVSVRSSTRIANAVYRSAAASLDSSDDDDQLQESRSQVQRRRMPKLLINKDEAGKRIPPTLSWESRYTKSYDAAVLASQPEEIRLLQGEDQCVQCLLLDENEWQGNPGNKDFCGCFKSDHHAKCLQCVLRNSACSFVAPLTSPKKKMPRSPTKKSTIGSTTTLEAEFATSEDVRRMEDRLEAMTLRIAEIGKEVKGGWSDETPRKRVHRE